MNPQFVFLVLACALILPCNIVFADTERSVISAELLGYVEKDTNEGKILGDGDKWIETMPFGIKSINLSLEAKEKPSVDEIDSFEYPLYSTKTPTETGISYVKQEGNHIIVYAQFNLKDIPKPDLLTNVNLDSSQLKLTFDFASTTFEKYVVIINSCNENLEINTSLKWDTRLCKEYKPIELNVINRNDLPKTFYFDVTSEISNKITNNEKTITFAIQSAPLDESTTTDRTQIYEDLFKNFVLSDFNLSDKDLIDGKFSGIVTTARLPEHTYEKLFGDGIQNTPLKIEISDNKITKLDIVDPFGGIIVMGLNTYSQAEKPELIITNKVTQSVLSESLTFFLSSVLPAVAIILGWMYWLFKKRKNGNTIS